MVSIWTPTIPARLGRVRKPLKGSRRCPPKYDPRVPVTTYKDYLGHVTVLLVGNDVYVADRQANRIQVFTKQGKFVREFAVAPETLGDGSAVGLALSKDGRLLFVGDHMNNVVWLVNRQTTRSWSRRLSWSNGGGFNALHMVATDSVETSIRRSRIRNIGAEISARDVTLPVRAGDPDKRAIT